MISFSPDGSMQTKINICSCEECLKGAFTKRSYEVGKKIYFHDSYYEDSKELKVSLKKMKSEESVLWMQ